MKNKRILAMLLAFVMVFTALPTTLLAAANPPTLNEALTAESDFVFDEATGTIKKYKGTDSEVVIPSEIKGTKVREIGRQAFGRKKLTSVVIPEGVEVIGDGAFGGNLFTELKLPEGLKKIGNQAFMANVNLKTINFPDSLKTIGHSIFMSDKALEGELTLGSNLELLDRYTFGDGDVKKLGSQNVKLNIAPGKTKLTILRGTFGSEQTNVDIPQGRPLLIKVNAFRTEEPVTLDFGTIDIKKGISKEDLIKKLQEKVLLNLYVTENDYKSLTEIGKGYELPIDWKLDSIDTNSEGEVSVESLFSFVDNDLRTTLELSPDEELTALSNRLTEIKLVGKLNFKDEIEEPSEPEDPSASKWTQEDFTYGPFPYKNRMEEETFKFGVTGFSEKGKSKIAKNHDLVIPKEVTIDGSVKQIEGIAAHAFKNIKMNSVTFSKVDKGIGFVIKDSAFENTGLNKVTLQEGLISIETRVFMNDNLTEISIPSTVWKIGSESFLGNKISKLDISDDVNMIQIDNYSFEGNKLSLVKLPYSIFKFRDFVFRDNPGYENSGVVRLETRNPDHLSSTTYIIPENEFHKVVLVTNVDRSELFKELGKVKKIERSDYKEEDLAEFDKVLNEVKKIFKDQESTQDQIDKALNDLIAAETKLRSTSPDRTKLRDSINRAEELIEGMFTPDSYKTMKDALNEAKRVLKDLNASSEEVKNAQINLDKAIDNLVINEKALYTSEDFTYEGKTITGFSESGKEKFKVNKNLILPDTNPEGEYIEVIGKGAFSLEKDPGVKFGTDTVSSANGMVSVKLPKYLKRIEESALRLNNFKNIEFPNTLEYIGIAALNGNRLEKVYLPDSVKEVEGGAFSLNQITELRLSPNMTKVSDGTFARNIYLKKLVIPEGIEVIEGSAFQGCPLTSLSISSTVKEIQQRAFTGQQLEELTIPGSVKKIGRNAFAHNIKWKRLKKLVLEEGIEEIESSAFRYSLLLDTNLPKSLKKLSDTAFRDAETIDKKPVVVKLYTHNPDHLKFNNSSFHEIILIEGLDTNELEDLVEEAKKIDLTNKTDETKKILEDAIKEAEYIINFARLQEEIDKAKLSLQKAIDGLKDKEQTPGEVPGTDPIPGEKPGTRPDPKPEVKPEPKPEKNIFEGIELERQAEDNRYKTAVEISKKNFESAETVILVNGEKEADALAASVLAKEKNAPILLIKKDMTPEEVAKEIERLGAKNIILIGGLNSIQEKAVENLKLDLTRIAGKDRFETAVEIAKAAGKTEKLILANGISLVDALTASSLAQVENRGIILVNKEEIPKVAKELVEKAKDILIVGGENSVKLGVKADRISGKDRFETAVKIAERAFTEPKQIALANSTAYADALVFGGVTGKVEAPILLTNKDKLPQVVKEYLERNKIEKIFVLGGENSISENLFK